MTPAPIQFYRSGDALIPLTRFLRLFREEYGDGEVVTLAEHEEGSSPSRRHLFACIRTAWQNLPEREAERFPTAESLRKYATIKAGHCDMEFVACQSNAEALRWAAVMRKKDPLTLVTVTDKGVTILTAKTIKQGKITKEVFQDVKDKILGFLADLISVTEDELSATNRNQGPEDKLNKRSGAGVRDRVTT